MTKLTAEIWTVINLQVSRFESMQKQMWKRNQQTLFKRRIMTFINVLRQYYVNSLLLHVIFYFACIRFTSLFILCAKTLKLNMLFDTTAIYVKFQNIKN